MTTPTYRFERVYPTDDLRVLAAVTMAMIHGPYRHISRPGQGWAFTTRGSLFGPSYFWELTLYRVDGGTKVVLEGTPQKKAGQFEEDRAREIAGGLFQRLADSEAMTPSTGTR